MRYENIQISMKRTINIGNYESETVNVSMSLTPDPEMPVMGQIEAQRKLMTLYLNNTERKIKENGYRTIEVTDDDVMAYERTIETERVNRLTGERERQIYGMVAAPVKPLPDELPRAKPKAKARPWNRANQNPPAQKSNDNLHANVSTAGNTVTDWYRHLIKDKANNALIPKFGVAFRRAGYESMKDIPDRATAVKIWESIK